MLPPSDPTYPIFPIFAFLGFALSLLPLAWHIQAWNSGTCAFMIWTAAACFNGFVNSIIWHGNLQNPAPVWCDISTKIIIGVSVGIPASILCISRRLYLLTSGRTASITADDKRRMVLVDLLIAAGIPTAIMILHYVVQGHRFDLLEDIGCYPVVYNTLPAYFLYFMWPILLGFISFIFSALTLRSFWLRRLQFSQLVTSNSSMSVSRYLRLIVLALIDILCTTPLGIYTIWIGTYGVRLAPWVSWDDTHFDFNRVGLVPALMWRSDPAFKTSVELTRWLPVVCAFLFFGLFGFASEARKSYQRAMQAGLKTLGFRTAAGSEKQTVKGLVSWAKPLKFPSTSSKRSSTTLHTIIPSQSLSSPSFDATMKTPYSATSFTTISTQVVINAEPPAYAKSNYDVEKFAGNFRLSLPPFSPLSSDGSTICGSPTAKAWSRASPFSTSRRLPSHMPEDVHATSPWTFSDDTPHAIDEEPDFVIVEGEEDQSDCAGAAHFTQEYTEGLDLPTLVPISTFNHPSMSQRTILSPERDRFYIVANDRSRTPSSPAPFSNSCSRNNSAEDVREQAEPSDDSRIHSTRSPSPGRRGIEVIVHTTETRTEETV